MSSDRLRARVEEEEDESRHVVVFEDESSGGPHVEELEDDLSDGPHVGEVEDGSAAREISNTSPSTSPVRRPRDPNRRVNFEVSPPRYSQQIVGNQLQHTFYGVPNPRIGHSTPLLESFTPLERERSRPREYSPHLERERTRPREYSPSFDRWERNYGRRRRNSRYEIDEDSPSLAKYTTAPVHSQHRSRNRPPRSGSLYYTGFDDSITSLNIKHRRRPAYDEPSSESDMAEIEYDQSASEDESISSFGFDLAGNGSKNNLLAGGNRQGSVHSGFSEAPGMSDASTIESSQKLYKVIRSHFTNLDTTQDLVVEVTEGQETASGVEDAPEPLFRWIHLDEDSMDFDDFLASAIQSPSLSLQEKRLVKYHLEHLRRYNEQVIGSGEGRYMDPFFLQELPDLSNESTMIALCLPYFHLDEYSANSEGSKSTKHPSRTLLQSFMSSTAHDRDMDQAVCKLHFAPDNHCYHVSQVWCLVLGEKLMITSARSDEQELCGPSVVWGKEPTTGFHHILVTDGGNCLWQIRPEECENWFAFTANFMEIKSSKDNFMSRFEDRFKLTLNGRSVTPENWYKVIAKAKKSTVRLLLSRGSAKPRIIITQTSGAKEEAESIAESEGVFPWQQEFPPPPPPTGEEAVAESRRPKSEVLSDVQSLNSLTPSDTHDSKEPKEAGVQGVADDFSVLQWLFIEKIHPGVSEDHSNHLLQFDDKKFNKFQDEIHLRMLNNKNSKEKKAYEECHEKELPEVTNFLARAISKDGGFAGGLSKSTLEKFFYAAAEMFLLFMPLDTKTSIAKHYWGAKIIPLDSPVFTASIEKFILVSQLAKIIKEELSKGRGPKPGQVDLPIEFQEAWLHCIAYLTLFKIKVKNVKHRDGHIETCQLKLHKARQSLGRKLAQVPLNRKEVAVPQTILSIIISRLLRDITGGQDHLNIAKTYDEYWKQMDVKIKAGRLKRAQPAIGYLQQEIKAVMKTLTDQLGLLESLLESIGDQKQGWSLAHDNAPKREMPLLTECIIHVKTRIKSFEEIDAQATELEAWNLHRIASTKDRHDKAIYAFTIVTIVFLPLSFVSGFLGMNTTDIRNTDTKQWVFWAAALPLTAVVILIALLWAGELGNAWAALLELFHINPENFSYKHRKPLARPKKTKKAKAKKAIKVEKRSEPTLGQLPRTQTSEAWEKAFRRTQTWRSVMD
ncbi:hypothetical protein BU16DRAFT_558643 [Lophium mytilinum]|uniref:Cora-domain-containing protein n=1 Tax=Lophium mytilinum TaxID=390894 RepID=A0A6A6R2S7_9PEZI|nr:hypothetical protein BU16DRAFT_558643 [Lophium mytilinum]